MNKLALSTKAILEGLNERPLAVILAGHNGSGKTTMWYRHLAEELQIPLINADRMMLSILPESDIQGALPEWAKKIRDHHESWMNIAQKGVEAFVAQAMEKRVPFAMETVFSHLKKDQKGTITESKADRIRDLQNQGYFVLLFFVGLSSPELSFARVQTRVAQNQNSGHDVPQLKLFERFPRTQEAIRNALPMADAAILVDNSRDGKQAFTIVHSQIKTKTLYDIRSSKRTIPREISMWLEKVCPRGKETD